MKKLWQDILEYLIHIFFKEERQRGTTEYAFWHGSRQAPIFLLINWFPVDCSGNSHELLYTYPIADMYVFDGKSEVE